MRFPSSTATRKTQRIYEEEKLAEIAGKETKGKIHVMIGAGSNDTKHMRNYVERIFAAGKP